MGAANHPGHDRAGTGPLAEGSAGAVVATGGHQHAAGHSHAVGADADRRLLTVALVLIGAFMVAEVVAGVLAGSLALLSDSAHMLTDAGAIVLALVAARLADRPPRGGYTFGLKRAEILSAQANGLTLLLLAGVLTWQAVRRLLDPHPVAGGLVLVTALVGVVVNAVASAVLRRADRSSLNIEGAFQHILTDLFAFAAAALAGAVILVTGWDRADALATLLVAALMIRAGVRLVGQSGRIFLEAAPAGTDMPALGAELVALPGVAEVHDLHVWQITSGQPALSAHVLVDDGRDCHAIRVRIERLLRDRHHIDHSTLQVDHLDGHGSPPVVDEHCAQPHGAVYRSAGTTPAGHDAVVS
jgi:cobalt-zinc-cadmium efflux system protein